MKYGNKLHRNTQPEQNYIKFSKLYKPNGKRETDRRKWQITHGQLKIENGLVYEPTESYFNDDYRVFS